VAVIGRPNAGKSSILNRIVGFERAIVFDQPGTTRDLVEVTTFLNEWPFRFVDTAGIRDATADPVEAVGVESAREAIATADACLLVVDLVDGWTEEDRQLWHSIENSTNRIPIAVLFNKSDLAESVTADRGEIYPPGPLPNKEGWVFHTSALKNTGIEEVTAWLFCQLLPREPDLQTPLPATREVLDACQSILADCQQDPVACKGQAALASLRQRLKKVLN
jgi:tRNA modification GTPase